ncbi:MAG: histidine kinase [Gammaproteobacteria bacterium]|jgi:CBS domain-containing protein|nr:histidine kinase [Gammaproteobacteria bacterium]
MSIGKMCRGEISTISENTSIQEAAKLMKEKHVGCLLVIKKEGGDGQKPSGIMTDRDIVLKILTHKSNLEGVTVAEAMSEDLLMLSSEQGIKEAIEAMRDKGVRRAPVIENNKILGIVAVDDLMILLVDELNQLADLVKHQVSGRK